VTHPGLLVGVGLLAPIVVAVCALAPSMMLANVVLTCCLLLTAILTFLMHRNGVGAVGAQVVPGAAIISAVGMAIETVTSIGWTVRPKPAPADVFFGAALPVFVIASSRLWRRHLWPGDFTVMFRGLIDSAQLVLAVMIVYWHLVVTPGIADGYPPAVARWGASTVLAASFVIAPLVVRAMRRGDLGSACLGLAAVTALAGAWLWSTNWDPIHGSAIAHIALADGVIAAGVLFVVPAFGLSPGARETLEGPRWLLSDMAPMALLFGAWGLVLSQQSLQQSGVTVAAAIASSVLILGRIAALRHSEHRLLVDLADLAFTDPLTGAGNRRTIVDAVAGREGWLLTMDLDGFKEVNDRFGHEAGDQVLRSFAERVRLVLPAEATFVRLGGDEFAVRMAGTVDDATLIAESIVEQARDPNFAAVSVSVGVAGFFPDSDPEQVMRNSDIALQEAKRSGKNRMALLDSGMVLRRLRELDLAAALSEGGLGQISVSYQPIVDISIPGRPPRIVAAEALARWVHPQLGVIEPTEFVAVAERHGLIGQLGAVIIRQVLDQLREWRDAGTVVQVSVNVSGLQLRDPDLVAAIDAQLSADLELARWVILEVTETVIADDVLAVEALRRLRSTGVCVAIDDFGIGSSTLTRLLRLPVDILKVDGELTRHLGSATSEAILDLVIAMGHRLGITVIAEAVEDATMLRELHVVGCRLGQGYHLGEPVDPADLALEIGRGEPELPRRREV
jgi:diguanylate cyclase (GGDEF)-like protein